MTLLAGQFHLLCSSLENRKYLEDIERAKKNFESQVNFELQVDLNVHFCWPR